jgi:hypothetical protein
MQEFMFIYRGGDNQWLETASEQEKAAVMAKWGAWMGALAKNGQLSTGGSPLIPGGKRLGSDGVVTDISASEFKELVTGYSIVKAKDYDEAVAIAKECPIFSHHNSRLEIRTVAPL